ncbi:hypothetical protein [Paraburkholderia kururiensis]|uniref:hypothetical protein n=1 Tax=Paraburkholderia kururiensis TaxID=984307 RepID=UPI00126925FA|nr:hypothetical protein [Paraburkholderia kururiensis]
MDHSRKKDVETEELRRKLDETKQQTAEIFKKFIDEKPKEFIQLFCEATLGIADESNPFRPLEAPSENSPLKAFAIDRSYFHGLAKILLDKVTDKEAVRSASGYTPFIDIVFENFSFSKFIDSDEILKHPDILGMQVALFENFSEPLACAIDLTCLVVFEGVPLYRLNEDGVSFGRIGFDEPLYNYICKRGEYFESARIVHLPEWVHGIYFRDGDLELHQAFFAGAPQLLDSERNLRRIALQNALGLNNDVSSKPSEPVVRKHQTTLLRAAQAVIDRYYGSQFDENDRSTITPQKAVVAWLQDAYGLSEREAESVDIVTRPDSARKR